jgi:hypothetical protein
VSERRRCSQEQAIPTCCQKCDSEKSKHAGLAQQQTTYFWQHSIINLPTVFCLLSLVKGAHTHTHTDTEAKQLNKT